MGVDDETTELDHLVKLGGDAARHPEREFHAISVGPSTKDEFNTVSDDLRPVACVLLKDSRFEFDSSFVSARTSTQTKALARLRADRPGTVLSVFGHADPVGDDDYNKKLSGRRAQAIYALLTRRTELWEDLFTHAHGGDNWGTGAIQTMLRELGHLEGPGSGTMDGPTREAVKSFQAEQGLGTDGQPGPATRKALFKAYMDAVCIDDQDRPFELDPKSDFLARGADADGKGDFQGCGEFNPSLLFSESENADFKKAADKTARNEANKPNRRVMIFLFRKGARVSPAGWPCPRAKEGVAACKKRFFSDADARRANGPERREYRLTHDTFACRFYDRMARFSPCEAGLESTLRCHISLLLRSNSGCVPLANRDYKITISPERILEGTTNQEGLLEHDDIPPGDYELEIEEHKTFVPATPVFRSRREHQVEGFFLLDDEHFVEVQVLDEKGAPLANVAMVLIKDDDSRERVVTDASGVARWEKVRTGRARVLFEDGAFFPEAEPDDLPPTLRASPGTGVVDTPGDGPPGEEGSDQVALDASGVAPSRRSA